MTDISDIVEPEMVACEECMKQIPKSEATVPEASEYVVHFCGLECYSKWQQEQTG